MNGRPPRVIALGAVFLLLCGPSLHAENAAGNGGGVGNGYEFEGSIMSEAVRATLGRVFGVGGDAANVDYVSVELTEHSPANAAARSALMPGWGQAFNGQGVKGTVYFLSFAATAVGAVVQYQKANDSYDKYVAKGLKDDALYDDYSQQRTQAYLLGGAAIFCWALSVLDAHRNGYEPVYSRREGFEVAWSGNRSDVRWRKRF